MPEQQQKAGGLPQHLAAHFGTDTAFKTGEIYLAPGALKVFVEFTLGLKDSKSGDGNTPLAKQILEINASKDPDFKYRLGIYQNRATKLKVWVSHNPTAESKDLMISLQNIVCEGVGAGIQMASKQHINGTDARMVVGVFNITICEPTLGEQDKSKSGSGTINVPTKQDVLDKINDPNDPTVRRRVHKYVRELVSGVITEFATSATVTFENMNDIFSEKGVDYIK